MDKTTVSPKTLRALIAPSALVFGAIAVAPLIAPDAPLLEQAAFGYPQAVLLLAAVLAWRLQRSRLFIVALLLGLTHILLAPQALGTVPLIAAAATVALPVGILLLAMTADRPIGAPRARLQLAVALAPAALLAALLATLRARVEPMLTYELIDARLLQWAGLPQPALMVAAVALPVVVFHALRNRRATDAGLAWTLLAALLALGAPAGSTARGLWILAAGVALVIALIEASYVMAFHDELTELPGRRALNQMLASVRAPYTVAVIDVDRFKSFNDRYGHDVGDQVLRMVASKLAAVGGGGRAFRSGGEEFTIVFPGRAKPEALPHVQAVREAVESARFTVRTLPRPRGRTAAASRGSKRAGGRQLGVTISAGLASFGTASTSAQAVLKSADKAMYRAKKNGRNRVVA